MASEADLGRALNALAATLNDQNTAPADESRIQEIVSGALGGEHLLTVEGQTVTDEQGELVARLSYEDGEWSVERVPDARKSEQLQQAEEKRSKQTEIEYQKPILGRFAIWKKRLSSS